MTRPPLPAVVDEFVPAPEVWEWALATFVAREGALHNPEHAHLEFAHVGVLWTSIENVLLPFNFSAVSSRFIGLPATFQLFGSLSVMLFGSGGDSFAAAAATLP